MVTLDCLILMVWVNADAKFVGFPNDNYVADPGCRFCDLCYHSLFNQFLQLLFQLHFEW